MNNNSDIAGLKGSPRRDNFRYNYKQDYTYQCPCLDIDLMWIDKRDKKPIAIWDIKSHMDDVTNVESHAYEWFTSVGIRVFTVVCNKEGLGPYTVSELTYSEENEWGNSTATLTELYRFDTMNELKKWVVKTTNYILKNRAKSCQSFHCELSLNAA